MRGFILIAVMAVAANARPEPPRNGYNYQQPAPLPQPIPSGNGGYNGNAQQIGFGNSAAGGFGNGNSAGGFESFSNGNNNNHQQQSFSQVATSFNSQPPRQSFQPQPQPQTIVQKHIYVHVPPPEDEAEVAQQQQSYAAPRKHYKIIFIKAPSAPSITQQIAAAQAQNEEKTLIYVLVKKPEDYAQPGEAAPVPQLPVSKPEVYFIKYKTQKQQQQVDSSFGQVSSNANSFGAQGVSGSSGITDFIAPQPASQYGPPSHK